MKLLNLIFLPFAYCLNITFNTSCLNQYWKDDSQNNSGSSNYFIRDPYLIMKVNKTSFERPKIMTKQQFKYGIFEWFVYIPQYDYGEITSVGNFLYIDDLHEIDWECGFGKLDIRKKLNISNDNTKSVCYMTTQSTDGKTSNTKDSSIISISGNQWYNLKIILSEYHQNYMMVNWKINDILIKTSLQYWNLSQSGFNALISLENLPFMGNLNQNKTVNNTLCNKNYAFWKYFSYVPE